MRIGHISLWCARVVMSLFKRLFNHVVTEVLVEKLSDSKTFQRVAVKSTHMAQDASRKAAEAGVSARSQVVSSVAQSEAATQIKSEVDVVKSRIAGVKAEFVSSIKDVADKLNK